MRESCLDCAKKHIAQAIILFSESKKGYPLHKYLALGHLAEAEDESIKDYPELANRIRKVRLQYEKGKYKKDLLEIIEGILVIEE